MQRISRRSFLAAAVAAPLAARLEGPAAALAALAATPRFRSRPDLDPPVVHVVSAPDGTVPGLIFVACVSGGGQPGPMIIDDDGTLVFFRPRPGLTVMNVGAHRLNGHAVLGWWEGQSTGGHGSGEHVLLGPDYRELTRVRAGNGLTADFHEFSLTARGSAILTAYEQRGELLDSVVQEVDVATGTVLLEWRASDHVPLEDSYAGPSKGVFDFAHLNAAAVDDDENLLISSRHTWTVYKVDRTSGEVIWRLGGKRSDFALGDGATFSWQHHVRRHADGTLSVFDNGAGPVDTEPFSRGLRLHVDESAGTASLVHQVVHPDHLLATAMGSMEVLDDGGAFVGWGSVPRFSEFAPDGTLRFDAGYPAGGYTYRALRRLWEGRPVEPPALAVDRGLRAGYASWNGATGIAHWRLRTGPRRNALVAGATVPKRSFETKLPLAQRSGWAVADALDTRGRVLASSRAVPLS